jgi:hypothetical protein
VRDASGYSRTGALEGLAVSIAALRPSIEAHITPERTLRYLTALADAPAPSTAASAMRAPVLRDLLSADGVIAAGRLKLDPNFANSGSAVVLVGGREVAGLWYFAHLDTISYLIQSRTKDLYPLIPFCYHLTRNGRRPARVYRYDLATNRYGVCAEGQLISEDGAPFFCSEETATLLVPGDRVVPITPSRLLPDGTFIGHLDNAGGVAALALAAPVLAEAGVSAMLAFPDEEEGPEGCGSQVMGRGGSRIVSLLPAPDLAIVADMQQARGRSAPDGANETCIGKGAVLSEFSSLARGAVTPPHLYALARHLAARLAEVGVRIQESSNTYTSRSDDVSVLLKTPNILLLGFPGSNRHFDDAEPTANLFDVVDLAKALVYVSALRSVLTGREGSKGAS